MELKLNCPQLSVKIHCFASSMMKNVSCWPLLTPVLISCTASLGRCQSINPLSACPNRLATRPPGAVRPSITPQTDPCASSCLALLPISDFQLTGASIQVASEVLPNSSERTVTISGTAKAISKCIRQLCHILIEVSHGLCDRQKMDLPSDADKPGVELSVIGKFA